MPPLFQSVYNRFLLPPLLVPVLLVFYTMLNPLVYIVCGCEWCNVIWICHPFIPFSGDIEGRHPCRAKSRNWVHRHWILRQPGKDRHDPDAICHSGFLGDYLFPINCGTACPFVLLPAHSGVCINWFDEFSYRSFLALLLCNLRSKPRCTHQQQNHRNSSHIICAFKFRRDFYLLCSDS